jgi:hypothetical protein
VALVAEESIGPYPIGDKLGWGGFADVYQTHAGDGTPLVLKVAIAAGGSRSRTIVHGMHLARCVRFHTGSTTHVTLGTREVTEVFRAEASALRSAAGHRLPRLVDELVTADGLPVLVLEQLPTPWSVESAPIGDFASILEGCADLQIAGLQGHGDLKPDHVFLDAEGEFVFIDPAYRSDPVVRELCTLTPAYCPCDYLGTVAGDVCAVAVMLHQRLTGELPAMSQHPSTAAELWRAEPGRRQPDLAAVSPSLAGAAEWANAVLGWVEAVLGSGGGIFAFAHAEQWRPEWLGGQVSAASALRVAAAAGLTEA